MPMGRRWGRELTALVAEQAAEMGREARTTKLPRHRGEVRFSELAADVHGGFELDPETRDALRRGRKPRPAPRMWSIYLGGHDAH